MESSLPATVIYDYSSLRSCFSEYMEKTRSNKRTLHISVIAMTSSIQMSERKECTKLGADLCLSFQFNVEYLQAVIEKLIDKRERRLPNTSTPLSAATTQRTESLSTRKTRHSLIKLWRLSIITYPILSLTLLLSQKSSA